MKKTAVYIHIPFCPSGCKFCHFYLEGKKQPWYIDLLKKEFSLRFWDEKLQVDAIHIGGGTPNLLSNLELQDLLVFLNEKFFWFQEYSIELHPSLLTHEQLDIIHRSWVNRISFGIQSLDESILSLHTRVKARYDKLWELIQYAQNLWFQKINFDFIYDLIWDSSENIDNNFRLIQEYKPSSVYYYRLRKFTEHLQKNHRSNEKRAFWYYLKIKNNFKNAGYKRLNNAVYFDNTQLKWEPPFLYDEIIYSTEHDLIGLWVAATSEGIEWNFTKNYCSYDMYKSKVEQSIIPTDLKFHLRDESQILNRLYFFMLQKHTFFLDDFLSVFWYDIDIEKILEKLKKIDFIKVEEGKIQITEKWHYYFDEKLGDILFSEFQDDYELLKKL